jgi:hypothetical protein
MRRSAAQASSYAPDATAKVGAAVGGYLHAHFWRMSFSLRFALHCQAETLDGLRACRFERHAGRIAAPQRECCAKAILPGRRAS